MSPPDVQIDVLGDRIVVADNGPGLPAEVIDGVLDFSVRVSSREAYVSPTRGAQGNALKTMVAMPFVLDGKIRDGRDRTRAASSTRSSSRLIRFARRRFSMSADLREL